MDSLSRVNPRNIVSAWHILLVACGVCAAGIAPAQDFAFEAVAGFGGSQADIGVAVTTDAAGNVYLAGGFRGTVDFDPGAGISALTSNGAEDAFVAKLNAAGELVWAINVGGPQTDRGVGIAVDAEGNVYLTGFFGQSADFDPGAGMELRTSDSFENIFTLKLNSSGALVWAAAMPGNALSEGDGVKVAVDADGNVYTVGYFDSVVDFDPGQGVVELTASGNTEFFVSADLFVSKLDADGEFVWARQFGGTQQDFGLSLALDDTGNVYATGSFEGTVDFDPGPGTFELTGSEDSSAVVLQLMADGSFGWAAAFVGDEQSEGFAVATDATGVYVTGAFEGTVDFEPGAGTLELTSDGMRDIFVAKLDLSGALQWVRQLGGNGAADYGYGIAVDAENVYVTGTFEGTADFDPGAGTLELMSAGGDDAFLAILDTAGDVVSAFAMGGSTTLDAGYSVAADGEGGVYTTGIFGGTADFESGNGSTTLTSSGSADIYLATHRQDETPNETPTDINGDNNVDAVDVQLVINAALGIDIDPSFDADVNDDNVVDAVDVQLVINAALN